MDKTKKLGKHKKASKKSFGVFVLLAGLFFLLIAGVLAESIFSNSDAVNKNDEILKPNAVKIKDYSSSTSSSLLKPITYPIKYQAATPKPTPEQVYTGFCLNVPVLTYHHIQPQATAVSLKQTSLNVDNGMFDQQIGYLASKGYTPISALALVNALRTHTQLAGKSIVITMDDGYADNDTYALPVLKKYNFNANLMLATGLVGSSPDMLSWSQVLDMKNSGLIYFTNHTWSHYSIANGPQSKIESEIDTAATQIKQYAGQDTNIFTYPYGTFNNNAIQTLQKKGYIGGFSTIPGHYQCDSFIMTLHRTRIGNAPLSNYGL